MTKVVTLDGQQIYFDAAVNLMDDEIREELHAQGIESAQEFIDAYVTAHRARFGEDFTVN
jgi:hypothetical protein